jgi:hypothetical protein
MRIKEKKLSQTDYKLKWLGFNLFMKKYKLSCNSDANISLIRICLRKIFILLFQRPQNLLS